MHNAAARVHVVVRDWLVSYPVGNWFSCKCSKAQLHKKTCTFQQYATVCLFTGGKFLGYGLGYLYCRVKDDHENVIILCKNWTNHKAYKNQSETGIYVLATKWDFVTSNCAQLQTDYPGSVDCLQRSPVLQFCSLEKPILLSLQNRQKETV